MAKGKGIDFSGILMIIFFAVLFLYVGAKFVGEDSAGETIFQKPSADEISKLPLQVMKFLIIGAAVFGAYALFSKVSGGAMTKKDAFSLILVGIAFWILWDQVLGNLVGNLNEVSFTVAKKIGVMK